MRNRSSKRHFSSFYRIKILKSSISHGAFMYFSLFIISPLSFPIPWIALLHALVSYHPHNSKQVLTCYPIGIIVSLKLYHNRCTIVERSVHYSATNCSPKCNDLCTVVERMKWSLNDTTIKAEWHNDISYMRYQSASNQNCNEILLTTSMRNPPPTMRDELNQRHSAGKRWEIPFRKICFSLCKHLIICHLPQNNENMRNKYQKYALV